MSLTRESFYDKLIVQLKDPEIKIALQQNNETRMFDGLPDEFGPRFNWLFVNYRRDLTKLVRILRSADPGRDDAELGVCFSNIKDANAVREWAREILKHACNELLDHSNEINSKILQQLGKKSDAMLARNFIYAYFATYQAHILSTIADNMVAYKISNDRFTALTLLMKECPDWIEQVWPLRKQQGMAAKKWVASTSNYEKKICFFGNLAEVERDIPSSQSELDDKIIKLTNFE